MRGIAKMARYVLLLGLLMYLPVAFGNSAATDPHAKPAADPHAKPAADPHAKPEEAEAPPVPQGPRRYYFPGKVIPFPSFTANFLDRVKTLDFSPTKGHSIMLIFVASWCEPCQVLMPDFKHLARKYESDSTKVYFVYSHDTKQDAEGSAKEHQITQSSLMSNVDMLINFKNPEIPSIFIGDKWGYLADQYQKVQKSDLDVIDRTLGNINAL
jgi:thiol-disulfide isomerase/thioredoxin